MYVVTRKFIVSKNKEIYFSCKQCLPTKHDLLAQYHIDICTNDVKCEVCIERKNAKNHE